MADELKEVPLKNTVLMDLVNGLRSVQDFANSAGEALNPRRMEQHRTSKKFQLGDFLLGDAVKEGEKQAYGFSPRKLDYAGISPRFPELSEPRKQGVADLVTLAPLGPAGKGGALAEAAVKAPGGFWSPKSQRALSLLLRAGDVDNPRTQAWADKAVPRYMAKQMGTDRDPLNRMQLAPDATWEQVTDRLVRNRVHNPEIIRDADEIPLNIRPGEEYWRLNEGALSGNYPGMGSFIERLRHAGDFAATLPENDLMRMDLPTLLQAAERNQNQVAKRATEGYDPSFAEPAKKLTAQLRPEVEGSQGAWYRFTSGMDPAEVNKQVSLDTSILNHCVGGVCGPSSTHRGVWKNRWIPSIDPRTGQFLNASDIGPDARISQAASGYVNSVRQGRGDILSYRNAEGIPIATMETRKEVAHGQPREAVRNLLRAQPERGLYERWFKARAAQPGTRESQTWPLPGGGKGSPPRGMMSNSDIQTIIDMYPQYADVLTALMQREPPHNLNQLKGWHNWGVAPKYNQDMVETLGKLNLAPRMSGDLTQSGLFLSGTQRANEPLSNLKGWRQMLEEAGQHPGNQELLLRAMEEAGPALKNKGNHITKAEDAQALSRLADILRNMNAQLPRR